jgi:amidase
MDPFSSALEVAALIREKKISPVEVVDLYLERTDRLNPELNAVTWRRDEAVRAEAKAAEDAVMKGEASGPFFGVPIAIKDLVFVEGWPITFGSKSSLDHVAGFDSNVVTAFKQAGCLLLYRTNTPEFGILAVTENDAWGATRNPWDTSRTPGGSSGGSASAVAAGMAAIGHANDGGGSIRIPAACCGLVGLKPSRGRVSAGPFISDIMHGGVTEGCVSRTVADTAVMLDAISVPDPTAWYNAPAPDRPFAQEAGAAPGKLRIAYTTMSPLGTDIAPHVKEQVEKTAALLQDLGHEVFEGAPEWPTPEQVLEGFLTVWNTGTAFWDVDDWNKAEGCTKAMRDQAMQKNSLDYVRAVGELQMYSRQITQAWRRDFDVLLTPALAMDPVPVGYMFETETDDPIEPLMRCTPMVPFTPMVNVTGQPAISVPVAWTDGGLPCGMHFIGAPWDEVTLIRLAAQLEEAAPWRDRRPAIAE